MAMYRVGFTTAQSAELWERWKKDENLKSIGRAFGKSSSCICAHLRPSGGIMQIPLRIIRGREFTECSRQRNRGASFSNSTENLQY
jgi:hypothetical protein